MTASDFRRLVRKGEIVFREGEPGDCAYLIHTGTVEIYTERAGQVTRLAIRHPQAIFGEMAIIDDQPRTATVRALEDCELLVISREQLHSRFGETDPIVEALFKLILKRYRTTLARMTDPDFDESSVDLLEGELDEETQRRAMANLALERDLKLALDLEEFHLFYQPIISLLTGHVAGFEALIRWRHQDRWISPADFIRGAEMNGMIVPIGRWTLHQGFKDHEKFKAAYAARFPDQPPLFMAVNLSGRHFLEASLNADIDLAMRQAGARPSDLKIEITEGVLISNPDAAEAALTSVRQQGLKISIDDFGTGYSSLGYLNRFPIDTLKIDRSFVVDMHKRASMVIVKAITGMAKGLEMDIVAEGIETPDQAAMLHQLGCDYGQGYLFAKPMPLGDLMKFLASWEPQLFH